MSQYHDLLTQTLDDKDQYSDKMNNLRRQEGKLEEKIMEQRQKMENSTYKPKGLRFTLVRKIRKAGSSTGGRLRSRNQDTEQDSMDSPQQRACLGDNEMELKGDKMMFRRGVTLPPIIGRT